MDNWQEASLEAIGNGRAVTQFNFELMKAIANINDLNTEATAIRQVTLTVKIRPSSDRKSAELTYQATSKLAADAAGTEQLKLGNNGRGYISKMEQLPLGLEVARRAEGEDE